MSLISTRINYDNGFRLIKGEDINTIVTSINSIQGGGNVINTNIATVGNGTLTAAAIIGGVITRLGSISPFTDTTATAAQIIAALPSKVIGESLILTITNDTAVGQTIAGGTGVTVSGVNLISAFSSVEFLVTYSAANTITMYGYLIAFIPAETPGSLTTIGNGTIIASLFQGSFITRTGPVAAFTDTTDTAANIYAYLAVPAGASGFFVYKNNTAFPATIVGGTGVTIASGAVVPANSGGTYLFTIASPTSIILTNYFISGNTVQNEISTNLTTVGAGTITAAGITNGVTNRTGSTSAFTDTTDTAVNIIAAWPNAAVGESWEWVYYNNTGFKATLAAGVGVTLSGTGAVVPAGCWARYLVTIATATTATIQGIETSYVGTLPPAQFVTNTTTTTFAAGQLTGANFVNYTNTNATPGSIATRTAAEMIADTPNAYIGQTWVLRITNTGGNTLTVTAGSNVTLTGTMTVATVTTRDFICTITSIASPAITIQNIGAALFS